MGKDILKKSRTLILVRMMPPHNKSLKSISKEFGISQQSLCKWRNKARSDGSVTPGNGQSTEHWSSEDKFLVVLETYAINHADLAEYCRKKGLYKEQIDAWRSICLNAKTGQINQTKIPQELKEEKRRVSEIEKDLSKKRRRWQKLRLYYY
jgi:transposase